MHAHGAVTVRNLRAHNFLQANTEIRHAAHRWRRASAADTVAASRSRQLAEKVAGQHGLCCVDDVNIRHGIGVLL